MILNLRPGSRASLDARWNGSCWRLLGIPSAECRQVLPLNRNKRGVCFNLSTSAGKSVFLDVVREADVVLDNNSAWVMTNLGLGYDDVRVVNPGIIKCSMSGYGGTGPQRDFAAYVSSIETVSRLASVLGYGPGEYFAALRLRGDFLGQARLADARLATDQGQRPAPLGSLRQETGEERTLGFPANKRAAWNHGSAFARIIGRLSSVVNGCVPAPHRRQAVRRPGWRHFEHFVQRVIRSSRWRGVLRHRLDRRLNRCGTTGLGRVSAGGPSCSG